MPSLTMHPFPPRALAGGGLAFLLTACSGGDEPLTITTSSAGDTTVITIDGATPDSLMRELQPVLSFGQLDGPPEYLFGNISDLRRAPDGSIWLFDSQARALRKYDSSGTFLRNVGGQGAGPGEYTRINGLAIAADGRAVVWDSPTGKLRLYNPDGERLADWQVPGLAGLQMSQAVLADDANNIYVRGFVADPPAGLEMNPAYMFGVPGLLRFNSTGTSVDSIVPPLLGVERQMLIASADGGGGSMYPLPFGASEMWTFSPRGYAVVGRSDVYELHLDRPSGVLRIVRRTSRLPVTSAESEDAVRHITETLRRTDPEWRWSGPEVPTEKPAFKSIRVDEDGRIWVEVSSVGEPIPEDELPRLPPALDPAQRPFGFRFRERPEYDVFAADGTFLWHLSVPRGATISAATGDYVWAVVRDSNDVQTVTKFRVVR